MKITERRLLNVALTIAAFLLVTAITLKTSVTLIEADAYIAPDYPHEDIVPIILKEQLTDSEYKILFYQTGLAKSAVDEIREHYPDYLQRLLRYQNNFFGELQYICEKNSPISSEESVTDENGNLISGTVLAPLHNGYILITKASHTYGWRNGHSAIIVDAFQGKTLESVVLGENSSIQNVNKWTNYPDFILLRLKGAPKELMNEVAQKAKKVLLNIPYDPTVGIFSSKFSEPDKVKGTHCSHLIWQAYRDFGYDLDSDGGLIVTPKDIANSPYVEVVQVFGVDPERIWP